MLPGLRTGLLTFALGDGLAFEVWVFFRFTNSRALDGLDRAVGLWSVPARRRMGVAGESKTVMVLEGGV